MRGFRAIRFQQYVFSLDQLSELACPLGTNDPLGEIETRRHACLRVRPVGSFRVKPASEFIPIGHDEHHFLEMEELVAARGPCCPFLLRCD